MGFASDMVTDHLPISISVSSVVHPKCSLEEKFHTRC